MLFSCGGNLDKEITTEMFREGYTGKGTRTFAITGSKYVGEFKDGKFHGQGIYTYANGRKYVGEHKDGKANGQGTFTWQNPWEQYVGEWKDEKPNGQGTRTKANGDKYVGEWKDGNMRQGTFTAAAGGVLKGIFENGEFIGE